MRQIPRRVLTDTVTHSFGPFKNGDGETEYASSRTIKHVRVEECSKVVYSKDNTAKQLTSLMFYDCVNSEPRGVSFVEGDAITCDGITHTIELIDRPKAANKVHHLEVGLI